MLKHLKHKLIFTFKETFERSITSMKITPVVLCGGSGTRLWPLSRKSFPKQFVPLIGNKSLLQLTLERLLGLALNEDALKASNHIVCVASEQHRFLVSDAIEAANLALGPSADLVDKTVLLEPVGKNTASAMALAALAVKSSAGLDGLILFCPADHHIPDTQAFVASVQEGVVAAKQGAIDSIYANCESPRPFSKNSTEVPKTSAILLNLRLSGWFLPFSQLATDAAEIPKTSPTCCRVSPLASRRFFSLVFNMSQ